MSAAADDDAALADKWLRQRVFVRKGRYVGQLGVVVGFANGRLRVRIGADVVNKQESQLELYDPALHAAATTSETPGAATRALRPATKAAPSLIGSRVRILNGKYGGHCGFVSKGGNGYFAVEIEGGSALSPIVMKRSSELAILSSGKTAPGETWTVTGAGGDDVRKAAVILLDLMQSEIGSRKRSRSPDRIETIEGY